MLCSKTSNYAEKNEKEKYVKEFLRGREVGLAGVGWRGGEKMQTTVIEEQF